MMQFNMKIQFNIYYMKINRISESLKKTTSVLDVEDYLQEVWDKYRKVIKSYTISNLFWDAGSAYEGDELITKGEKLELTPTSEKISGRSVIFDIDIFLNYDISDNLYEWEGSINIDDLSHIFIDIKTCLQKINPQQILYNINNISHKKGPYFSISVISNEIIP